MLTILYHRAALDAPLCRLKPEVASFLHCSAGAVCDVYPFPHLDFGRRCELVSFLLLRKRLQPALAVGVHIVDHPGGFLDALAGGPDALADAHSELSLGLVMATISLSPTLRRVIRSSIN